jgi:hypothetical protein
MGTRINTENFVREGIMDIANRLDVSIQPQLNLSSVFNRLKTKRFNNYVQFYTPCITGVFYA